MNYQERHWKSKFGVKYTKKQITKTYLFKCSKKIGKINNAEFGTNVEII